MLVFAYIRYCFNDTSGRESSIGTGKLSLRTGEPLRRFQREIVEYHQLTMQDVACIFEWGHWRGYSSLSHQGITSSKHQYANFSPVLSNSCGSPCTKRPMMFLLSLCRFPKCFSVVLLYPQFKHGRCGMTLRSSMDVACLSSKQRFVCCYVCKIGLVSSMVCYLLSWFLFARPV